MLFISVHTVERHRANLMSELDIEGTAALVKHAIQKEGGGCRKTLISL